MPKTALPHRDLAPAPESHAPAPGNGEAAPASDTKPAQPVAWPRDLNAESSPAPVWGSDPEALRNA
jgi:hypothetical protein